MEAGWRTTTRINLLTKPFLIVIQKNIINKHKCSPVTDERCLHSIGLFNATIPPQEVGDSYENLLTSQV
jgi:hypothetical protein